MPILRKERDIFPDNLFELSTDQAPWVIAHLRSRQEKSTARMLFDDRKPFYLPQIVQKTKGPDRTFVSHLPLFPGYIFLRQVAGLQQRLWQTRAVANMIEVPDQAQLTEELLQIRELEATGAVLTPCVELAPGDPVRITEGAFSGYVGTVTAERGALRLIVSVSIIKKAIAVEFPREFLAHREPTRNEGDRRRIQARDSRADSPLSRDRDESRRKEDEGGTRGKPS